MDAADLAAKKLLLPFINELSCVEIALAEVRCVSCMYFTCDRCRAAIYGYCLVLCFRLPDLRSLDGRGHFAW